MVTIKVIGDNIRALRARRDLSQEDLAGIIGVSKYTVINWEKGKSCPTFDRAIQIADCLGVSLETLGAEELTAKVGQ